MKRSSIYIRSTGYRTMLFKTCLTSTLAMLLSAITYAQSGATGMQNATTEVKGYFVHGTNLMYAIGAIVGIVGAIKVYNKWNSGDQDTGKVAASWFGSCIFLIVVTAILKGFFGV